MLSERNLIGIVALLVGIVGLGGGILGFFKKRVAKETTLQKVSGIALLVMGGLVVLLGLYLLLTKNKDTLSEYHFEELI